uniref:N(4)-(beta-N-acetylglucosaminyl)-L-asparaginase n=1 Tax=Panagrellus redivivus TaxID=6233 RepID=A0A7E4WB92_PANRE
MRIVLGTVLAALSLFASIVSSQKLPLVVSTWGNADFQAAGQRAFDYIQKYPKNRVAALVEGLSECESRQCDTTVGYGGSPDESGETTLDALVLDGPGQKMGAVGDLRKIKDAARVAWAVMNYTKHSFLAGDQATKFALQMGFQESSLITNVSTTMHTEWLNNNCQPNFWRNVAPNPLKTCGPYKPNQNAAKFSLNSKEPLNAFSQVSHDTIGMVVIDTNGDVAAGTSTNGARNKIPGRIGDSPIPGAGAYCDNAIGGAAATGDGDIMMRFLPSFLAVEKMRSGTTPRKAAEIAILRMKAVYPEYFGAVIAANKLGEHGAACNGMATFSYVVGDGNAEKVQVYTVKCF